MLTREQQENLLALACKLVDQHTAKVIIRPQQNASGFWFGGGNMIEQNGVLYLSGRYRNFGDSRMGLGKGERGLELAIFRSHNRGQSWHKIISFSKKDLSLPNKDVLSIEGTALHVFEGGVELFISTEKAYNPLPDSLKKFQKQGTGNWSVEHIAAPTVEELSTTDIETVLETSDPRYVHVKDPFIFEPRRGSLVVLCCTHPFNWSSSNTAYFVRSPDGIFSKCSWDFLPRGTTWDVAIRRGTALLRIPRVGCFKSIDVSLFFYDGGESLRNLDEHRMAVQRPRGYSCEELGGIGYITNDVLESFESLSPYLPEFCSPWGSGCSRYVDALAAHDGIYVTWQQSQSDFSQPLVLNFVLWDEVESVLMR